MGRHKTPISEADRARLLDLIIAHDGNLSAMARALAPIHRQALSKKLERAGLLAEADVARALAGVRGRRLTLPGVHPDPVGERRMILDAVARHPGYRDAARALGISDRTMLRRMARYRIKPEEVRVIRRHLGGG